MRHKWIPLVLIILGTVLVFISAIMPLLDWNLTLKESDFSQAYEIQVSPSTLTTGIGESLDDAWILYRNITISNGERECRLTNVDITLERPAQEKWIEQILVKYGIPGELILLATGLAGIVISVIYLCWGSIAKFINVTVGGVVICLVLISVLFALGPIKGGPTGFTPPIECQGSITLQANILRFHYETVILLLLGISAEVGMYALMLRQLFLRISAKARAGTGSPASPKGGGGPQTPLP